MEIVNTFTETYEASRWSSKRGHEARPISLLPICGKILEKNILNLIYEVYEENDLLCEHQSGFRPSDSCEYQLLSIVHDIYAFFDCNPPLDDRGTGVKIMLGHQAWASKFTTWWVINFPNFKLCLVIL